MHDNCEDYPAASADMRENGRDCCPFCGAGVPSINLARTSFYCPGCGESWSYVATSEEEIGDED